MKIWSPKTALLLPAIGGLALLGLGGAALAKPVADGARGERGHRGLCATLECTDQQKEELRAVKQELRADSKADREAIKRLHETIATEFAKATPDEAAMRAAGKQIAVHKRELEERGFDAMMEIHALLNPAQRAELAELMKRRGPRALMGGKGRHGRKGKGKGKGGPETKAD